MTTITLYRNNGIIETGKSDTRGVRVHIIDTGKDIPEDEAYPAPEHVDTDRGVVGYLHYSDDDLDVPAPGAVNPLMLVEYDDTTYVTLGGQVLCSVQAEECTDDALHALMRLTHPQRLVRVVDGKAAIEAQWLSEQPGSDVLEITEEGDLVARLLASDHQAFERLPDLHDLYSDPSDLVDA